MSNHTTKALAVQKSLADLTDSDPRPLPLVVAERWNFSLQYHASDGKTFFAVQDWIVGLVGVDTKRAADTWRKLKISEADLKSVSVRSLQYHATDGKIYNRDFVDAEMLYLISQHLRATEDRPMLDAIRRFLAESGALMDAWRLNPEQMLSAAQSRMEYDINRHEKAGLGNRPEIELLRSQLALSKTLKELKGSVGRLLELSGKEWGDFHNEEMFQLLGHTATEIKKARNAKSARGSLNVFEANGMDYCEKQLIALLSMQKTIDKQRLKDSVKFIFAPVGASLQGMLQSIGIDALSGKPLLTEGNR